MESELVSFNSCTLSFDLFPKLKLTGDRRQYKIWMYLLGQKKEASVDVLKVRLGVAVVAKTLSVYRSLFRKGFLI